MTTHPTDAAASTHNPGRAAVGIPAGSATPGLLPAGPEPRTWTIEMPAGMDLLNANDRDGHWARRQRITTGLRQIAGWTARAQNIPPLQRAHILAVYEPPDRRKRDAGNLYPSFKACIDGIVTDAGVLPDDDSTHLDGPDMRIGEKFPRGRLVLHITEVAS